MILQNRDREILKLCLEQQFLLSEHLEPMFSTYKQLRRRVTELKAQNYIKEDERGLLTKKNLIRLTHKGKTIALESGAINVSYLKNISPNLITHDALVTSVRLRLQGFWNAKFIPERAIQMEGVCPLPDGLFAFPTGKVIALEVENSDKGKTRFLKGLERWNTQSSLFFILYVCSNPTLELVVRHYLSLSSVNQPMGVAFRPPIYYSHFK